MPSIGVNLRVTGHCSQGGRKYMEDFFSVAYQQSSSDERDLEYAFIGIYDGHGGAEAATYAKEHLINLIVNQKQFWSDDDQDVLRAIREGYIATHLAMWREEQGKWPKTASGLPSTAGTTASVAFIRHGKIYIGHVGDSGIVLGYQNDNERFWRAKPLTVDHKPESEEEKTRIMKSGGKVVNKAGVPRVVWNRPRIGHKGPVRRSTLIDEIPFLAVARSLGDLWSYNSDMDEFVVSPEPDVRVVKIDPKRFKCLVFGTDGLWNVVTPQAAIDSVRYTETLNERSACETESKEWANPSKYLVDKALERWSTRKMRADNTSVVIVMVDPPGPPKRDVLKSTVPAYSMDYLDEDIINQQSQALEIEPIQNFTMFDHSTNEHIDMDGMPLPTSGLTVLTRYENITESDVQKHNHQHAYEHVMDVVNENIANETCINSFAESYNSIINSNLNDQYRYDNGNVESNDDDNNYQFDDANTTHQHNGKYSSPESIYSLTKLQTRSEQQQYNLYGCSMPSEPIPSTSHAMPATYQPNLIDHCYVAPTSTPITSKIPHKSSPSTKRSLDDGLSSTFLSMMPSISRSHLPSAQPFTKSDRKSHSEKNSERSAGKRNVDKNAININEANMKIDINESDNSIQINEISSSDSKKSMNNNDVSCSTRSKKLSTTKRNEATEQHEPIVASRKVTRSATNAIAFTSTGRITRSTIGQSRSTRSVIISKISKSKNYLQQKQSNTKTNGTQRIHKENIAEIVRKLPLESIVSCQMTRTKRIIAAVQGQTSRTLRSQNAPPAKEQSSAKNQSNSSSSNKMCRSNMNIIGDNAKVIVCKKPPKRLLNDSLQNKSQYNPNISNKMQKLSMPSGNVHGINKKTSSTQPASSSLRWKVLVTKKPLIVNQYNQLINEVNRSTMITRRTRIQQ